MYTIDPNAPNQDFILLGDVMDSEHEASSQPSYWTSRGNWELFSENGRVLKTVQEKYTLGFFKHFKAKAKHVTKVVPIGMSWFLQFSSRSISSFNFCQF